VQQDPAATVLDAQIHPACVQVHAEVELMLSVIEAHKVPPRGQSVVDTVSIPDLPRGGPNQYHGAGVHRAGQAGSVRAPWIVGQWSHVRRGNSACRSIHYKDLGEESPSIITLDNINGKRYYIEL
jgi:hypothetical protein